jgi:hypothetical protein
VVLHVVDLTSEATWRAPVDELIRVGPFKITMPLPTRGKTAGTPLGSRDDTRGLGRQRLSRDSVDPGS